MKPEGFRLPKVQANPDVIEEFRARLPSQVELCLRLTLERLQNGLGRAAPITNHEVAALADAAEALHRLHQAVE